ncbi:hypothetical protein OsJ_30098 [Oryza sativa Japonica Group]|uniref:Endoglucanase n=1 Tax=Oryza sativa subsp. japonica TaxID=39947 RepID=B9G4P7_ORYSJ|nr:hypothetical protein OsJ_30098 [Oryza sativa Japonica Group]
MALLSAPVRRRRSRVRVLLVCCCLLLALAAPSAAAAAAGHDYGDALAKSILFFEGQRSGRLPAAGQRAAWRGDSAVSDGGAAGVRPGGRVLRRRRQRQVRLPDGVHRHESWRGASSSSATPCRPRSAPRRPTPSAGATDYLLKTISNPGVIFIQVGDPTKDHGCWERPEDMDTARTVYNISAARPGSDVAGETAAALAAASMVFRDDDPAYAARLLAGARSAFEFADEHKGAYSDDPELRAGGCPFYCDFDGYQDELLWGAAWLRRASKEGTYLDYIQNNGKTLGAEDSTNEFGWDNKHAGINVLVSKEFIDGEVLSLQSYKEFADGFICTLIPESSSPHITYTPGGMIYKPGGSNMQHVTSISFLLLTYAKYLSNSSRTVNCGNVSVGPATLQQLARKQADYILGDNPMKMSYMVGYGDRYPQRIHHRGSSLPSIKSHPQRIACNDGTPYYNSSSPNPNPLIGAVVGGPGEDDVYEDDRADFRKSEPTTYINAPLVGVLAYLVGNPDPGQGHVRH